jgi:hypothetical protein
LDDAWHELPAGFVASEPPDLDPALRATYLDMRAVRREEGYGDLVGLAWIQRHRPQQYSRLHAWLVAERSKDLIQGSHHDTLAWVRLAEHGIAPVDSSLFAGPAAMWAAGLAVDD